MSLSFRLEIPIDVVMDEILTRLPSKSLMRFKCVSKLWSSFISSRYFSNRFFTAPSPRLYICLRDRIDNRKSVILSSAPDTSTPSSFVVDHNLTIPVYQMGSYILQNLRGFMCFTFRKKLRIYNPATRKLVTLPAIRSDFLPQEGSEKFVTYYFGYDPINDQYKVVCSIGGYLESFKDICSEHWVFVLKAGDSWKKVVPTQTDFCPHLPTRGGLCIDGVIYYLALTDIYSFVIMSFDIRSEEFKMIQIPCKDGDIRDGRVRKRRILEYDGKVTVFDHTYLEGKGRVDLCVLEDAEDKKWSWKTLVLQPSQLHLINNIRFKVKGTTQNGHVLLIPKDLLPHFYILCYDLQSNDLRKIEIQGIPEHWFSKNQANRSFDVMFTDQIESLLYLET